MTSKKGRRFIWRAASSLSELQFQLKNSFRMLAPLFRHISKMTAKTATIIEILKFMTNILFSARSFVHHGLTRYNTEKNCKTPRQCNRQISLNDTFKSVQDVANTSNSLARVVWKTDNAIHRINHSPVDSVVCFVNTYPLDSDLSGG